MQSGTMILGRIGSTPWRDFNKKNIVRFSVYEKSFYIDKTGKKQIENTKIGCHTLNKTADNVERYVKKGANVCVWGILRRQSYYKDGDTNTRDLELKVEKFVFTDTSTWEKEGDFVEGI